MTLGRALYYLATPCRPLLPVPLLHITEQLPQSIRPPSCWVHWDWGSLIVLNEHFILRYWFFEGFSLGPC